MSEQGRQRSGRMPGGRDLFADEPAARYAGPPPQCVTCSRFVNVGTARRIYEYGDYGTVYSVEFECKRCADAR